jgi:Tfp pilus assembly protein PilZ
MTYASEVSVIDIGMGGVSLTADKRLNIGAKYMLRLEGSEKAITVTCEVAWSKMSGTRKLANGVTVPLYTAGMKFVAVSPDVASALMGLVEAVGLEVLPGPDRRVHARFPPKPPGIALLDLPAGYIVKTISLSGMLIECAEAVARESRVPMVLSLQDGPDIEFVGRVVSCLPTQDETPGRHDIAIEFMDLTGAGRDALAAFIEFSFGNPDPSVTA